MHSPRAALAVALSGILLAGCSSTPSPRVQRTPAALDPPTAARLAQCQILARRAHIRTPLLTQAVVFALSEQTLRDHGVLPPRKIRGVWHVHRVTQADIAAASDDLKVCFPPE